MPLHPMRSTFLLMLLCALSSPLLAQNYYSEQNREREHRAQAQRDTDRHYDSMAADNRARLQEEARQAERERWADSYSRGANAPETRGQRIVRAARNGDPKSMFIVSANYYAGGDDFEPDPAKGLLWLRRAAEAGHPEAQMTLASMLVQGRELPLDKAQAAYWAGRAANQGFAAGDMMLGMMYENGDGVPQDPDEARAHYRKAAARGVQGAQARLDALR